MIRLILGITLGFALAVALYVNERYAPRPLTALEAVQAAQCVAPVLKHRRDREVPRCART